MVALFILLFFNFRHYQAERPGVKTLTMLFVLSKQKMNIFQSPSGDRTHDQLPTAQSQEAFFHCTTIAL